MVSYVSDSANTVIIGHYRAAIKSIRPLAYNLQNQSKAIDSSVDSLSDK